MRTYILLLTIAIVLSLFLAGMAIVALYTTFGLQGLTIYFLVYILATLVATLAGKTAWEFLTKENESCSAGGS